MNINRVIPAFGDFSPEEEGILKRALENKWNFSFTPLPISTDTMHQTFENLPFQKEISIPVLVIGSKLLQKIDSLPSYNLIRENRHNCKVLILLQEECRKENLLSPGNWPDFFLDMKTGSLLSVTASAN